MTHICIYLLTLFFIFPSLYSLPKSNLTLHRANAEIICYEPTDVFHPIPVTFDACRPIFQTIRSFPYFGRTQTFEWGTRPVLPPPWPEHKDKPPFNIPSSGPEGRCIVHVAPFLVNIIDNFSWADVKRLGQDILQTCEGQGYGGRTRVGEAERWVVRVFGYAQPQEITNTTQTGKLNSTNDGTIVPAVGNPVGQTTGLDDSTS